MDGSTVGYCSSASMAADPTRTSSGQLTIKNFASDSKSPYKFHNKLDLIPGGQQLWYIVVLFCTICFLLFRYNQPEFSVFFPLVSDDPTANLCAGRYIYIHNISSRFNTDLVRWPECRKLCSWYDMCPYVANDGIGIPLNNSEGVLSETGWYYTEQFTLGVLFHSRMKQYQCLTNDSSIAAAIYVPFYAGLEVGRHLWDFNNSVRDSLSLELTRWLKAAPEWKVMDGRDHFLMSGRTTWDLTRPSDTNNWGNKFLLLPETRNMTVLIIESSPKHSNDFAIPYPTYFHPSRDSEVLTWQNRMRKLEKPWLFCYAGGARAADTSTGAIRDRIVGQCNNSTRCSSMIIGSGKSKQRYTPSRVIKLFQSSVFCIQPPGDTLTRRSTFDSMIAGCIPVFFTPASAYTQYIWHLPRNHTNYSVLIPEYDFKEGKVEIEEVLKKFSEQDLRDMREEVIKTIPRLIYRNPKSIDYKMKDAFDVAVEGVLKRVEETRRFEKQGLRLPVFDEGESWKRALGWTGGEHEWDYYFGGRRHH